MLNIKECIYRLVEKILSISSYVRNSTERERRFEWPVILNIHSLNVNSAVTKLYS